MTTLYVIGGASLVVGYIVWYALRQSKKAGIAEQVARDQRTVTDAEFRIHDVQAEDRDPEKTKGRLKRGDF